MKKIRIVLAAVAIALGIAFLSNPRQHIDGFKQGFKEGREAARADR